MKMRLVVVLVASMFCASVKAEDRGPTLSGITNVLLNLVWEDGRWYPTGSWFTKGIKSGEELSAEIKNKKGKKVVWATFNVTPNYDGDFGKVNDVKQIWPVDQNEYSKLTKLTAGEYKLEVLYGKEVVWETPFEVKNYNYMGKDHIFATGPWTKLAYFYFGKGSTGALICAWFESPEGKAWYANSASEFSRGLSIKADIKKDGKVIISQGEDPDNTLQIESGKVVQKCRSISHGREINEKMASKDGEYEVTMYAGGGDKWAPVAQLKVKVVGGKAVMNENLTGARAPAKSKIITADAYYDTNLAKLENVLPASR